MFIDFENVYGKWKYIDVECKSIWNIYFLFHNDVNISEYILYEIFIVHMANQTLSCFICFSQCVHYLPCKTQKPSRFILLYESSIAIFWVNVIGVVYKKSARKEINDNSWSVQVLTWCQKQARSLGLLTHIFHLTSINWKTLLFVKAYNHMSK